MAGATRVHNLAFPFVNNSGFALVVIATCNPTDKLTAKARIADTLGLVLTHDGSVPQELYQLPTETPPCSTPSAATTDFQNIMREPTSSHSRGRRHHLAWLSDSCNSIPLQSLVRSHLYNSSWEVQIEYSTRTAQQYRSNCDEQHNTHRPTLTLNQVLSNEQPQATVLQPKPLQTTSTSLSNTS